MTENEPHSKPAVAGWVALHRSDETLALLENYPNAFLLLTQIALRAKWKDCPITGLKTGEALLGDWKKAGLHSPKAYQVAKQRLEKCGLVAFQGGNKGTRAMLVDSRIFSITTDVRGKQEDTPRGTEERPKGNSRGTNHKDTKKEGYAETPQFAPDGANSDPPPKISWSHESGFSGITDQDRESWSKAYPAVNLDRQLVAANEWLRSNPAKSKKSLWRKFITGWLARNQERGGDPPVNGRGNSTATIRNSGIRRGPEESL